MIEEYIRIYYDALAPSEKAQKELIIKLATMKKRRATKLFVFELIGSSVACFLLAFGVNYLSLLKNNQIPDEIGNNIIGSVMKEPNGFVFAALAFIILCSLFIFLYIKNLPGQTKNLK